MKIPAFWTPGKVQTRYELEIVPKKLDEKQNKKEIKFNRYKEQDH